MQANQVKDTILNEMLVNKLGEKPDCRKKTVFNIIK